MQTVFKWIDQFFHSIPEKLARSIRLGFIGVWVLLAGAVSYRACVVGQSEAPQDGQDLQLSRIKEQIAREENRNDAAEIQLPDPDQILPENSAIDDLPLPEPRRDVETLPGSADLRERDPNPESETLPPFLGEQDEIIFPRRDNQDSSRMDSAPRERESLNREMDKGTRLQSPDLSSEKPMGSENSPDTSRKPPANDRPSGNQNFSDFDLLPPPSEQ